MFGLRFLACVMLAFGGPAVAQTAPARDVVVTGRRETFKDARRDAARQFAKRITRPVNGQLARVRWPICPAVMGIEPALAAQIVERFRAVAREAGAPVAGADCGQANSTLIFAQDAGALLTDIRRTRPGWLAGLRAAEVERLTIGTAPARAWHITELLNEDGRAMRGSSASSGATAPTTNPGGVGLPSAPVLQVMGSSFLQPPTQQAISASFLVLDARASAGKSATQLADYAAMRLLAATQPPESGDGDTVLTLFSSANAPDELTDTDAAYLRALYHTPATEKASVRLDSIAGQMARARR